MQTIAENNDLRIIRMELGPFGTNSYLIVCLQTMDGLLIDAPGEANKVLQTVKEIHPRRILMTHNHMDHTGAMAELKTALNIPVAAHADDAAGLPLEPDDYLKDSDSVSCGNLQLDVLHTPGHTPGSLCFYIPGFLISGDTIFPGGPGKTWSAQGFRQIVESLAEKIFVLPGDTLVLPGHGEPTVLQNEKMDFESFMARRHDVSLFGDVRWNES
jgi:glyoxylase-like metal-dependent hydrolase (beta-lactamase superfamily II)